MDITPFAVEIWMNEWETKCEMNLAETCVQSLTIDELLTLSGQNANDLSSLLGTLIWSGIGLTENLRLCERTIKNF